MNHVGTDPGTIAGKSRITIHVDMATYRILCALASRHGEATANHAVFRIVVNEIKRLQSTEEWAADIVNEERINGLEGVVRQG